MPTCSKGHQTWHIVARQGRMVKVRVLRHFKHAASGYIMPEIA